MAVKTKRRKKTGQTRTIQRVVYQEKKPATRRRRRKVSGLSAGGDIKVVLMQVGMAVAGGALGKVARNALPEDMNPAMKAGIVAGIGVGVAKISKQPLLGAGMIGSAGAYYVATLGQQYNIPLLSEQNANFVLM